MISSTILTFVTYILYGIYVYCNKHHWRWSNYLWKNYIYI